MKRFLSILMAVMMICTMVVLPVAAQEASEEAPGEIVAQPDSSEEARQADAQADDPEMIVSFPGQDLLGHTWADVLTVEKAEFSTDVEANSSIENKTLSDGSSYMEVVMKNVSGQIGTIDRYLYFVGDKLFAVTNIFSIPEGYTMEQGLDNLKRYGTGVPLNLSTVNTLQKEMVSDQVTLKDGMSTWKSANGFIAVAGPIEDSKQIFIMLLTDLNAVAKTDRTQLPGVVGMQDLTPEETEKVNSYIDFLQAQTAKQVNEYIEFLKSQRQK